MSVEKLLFTSNDLAMEVFPSTLNFNLLVV